MNDKPMTTIEQIRLDARLLAIENILAALFAAINRRDGISLAQFSAAADEIHQALRQQLVVANPDTAVSDIVAAEVEQAIAALFTKIKDYTELASQSDNRSPASGN